MSYPDVWLLPRADVAEKGEKEALRSYLARMLPDAELEVVEDETDALVIMKKARNPCYVMFTMAPYDGGHYSIYYMGSSKPLQNTCTKEEKAAYSASSDFFLAELMTYVREKSQLAE